MQREVDDGVIISCDFCGTDWDQVLPMVEGHQGSVLCAACTKTAQAALTPADEAFRCTLCLMEKPAGEAGWRHPDAKPSPGLNRDAAVCGACVKQAAGAFSRDPDVEW